MFTSTSMYLSSLQYEVPKVGDASREKVKDFTYDYSYWSVEKSEAKYASQQKVNTNIRCLKQQKHHAPWDKKNIYSW